MLGQMSSGCVRANTSVALLEACEPATAKLHYWSVYPTNAVSESLFVISCDEKASCGTPALLHANALAAVSRGGSELLKHPRLRCGINKVGRSPQIHRSCHALSCPHCSVITTTDSSHQLP